ncbi:restriction endonuclease subunit S [Pseudomonas qingdaonensis]|uniref:restriction endonuclease subunit S n=1 Tax=Pseudomonas qingdaonensis TaxID=2056231 RepID=UPI0028A88F3D|nr:restriction endonuclease subunit S [Pseudomonas qingdaonensis]
MTALLIDNLPLLADAPNGIKKLRNLILGLALRGKLVPQDPNDEPASELLKHIADEKVRLSAQNKTKKQKSLADVTSEEKLFDLPKGWERVRFGVLIELISGQHLGPEEYFGATKDGAIPYLTGPADFGEVFPRPTRSTFERRAVAVEGDILLTVKGSGVGKTNFVDKPVLAISRQLMAIRPVLMNRHFVRNMLFSMADHFQSKSIGIAIPGISREDVLDSVVCIPPLDEQLRIIAKVDELMALCDRLEARQTDADSAHAQLVQALLSSLTQASDAEDFAQSWQRLAEHFHTLFTTESSIDALKQNLLQLAVMGKLVAQDPIDEPASELLKRIAEEKARLISEEGLRTTARDDVPEAEHYFMLHAGWASCRLGNLARFIDYRGRTPTKTLSGVSLITAKNVRPGFISREPQEFIAETDYSSWMTRGFPRVGDMLFTTEAPMGNVAIINIAERFALAQRVICFQLHDLDTGPFLKLAMMSSGFQAQLSDAATGMTATGIKSSRLKEIPVPIPPLAEQHRIVAKVDQLMALCDQLKARLNQARQVHENLASALVEQSVA